MPPPAPPGTGPARPLAVVVVEPYCTGSHQAWAEGLAAHSRHHITVLAHSGSSWRWRVQGSALTLADRLRRHVAERGRPDVLVVSGMTHLAALLGLTRAELHDVPVVLYLHENQLTYPLADGEAHDLTYAMAGWLGMAAADVVAFNSTFHHDELLTALPAFLERFPDQRHTRFLPDVAARCTVVPVGIDPACFALAERRPLDGRPPLVLWNHRWEHDKDPDAFVDALEALVADDLPFEVAVAGHSSGRTPAAFERARTLLGPRLTHLGTADDGTYAQLLASADVVVSTARHEFFGLAVAEAVAAGACPVLPHRLAYPELVPSAEPYLYDGPEALVHRLRWAITEPEARRAAADRARTHVARFAWPTVAPTYDELLERLAARPRG